MKNALTAYAADRLAALLNRRLLPATGDMIRSSLLITVLLSLLLSSCLDHRNISLPGQSIQSTNPKPAYAPDITNQSQAILEELGRLNPTPLYLLTPQEARTKPSVKDAVTSLLDRNRIAPPAASVSLSKRMIPTFDGSSIEIAVYTPTAVSGTKPVIVYYHGGGWVIANSDVYEASTVALAQATGAVVVSVNYRMAPEFKFPTAHEDAYAAYVWVRNNMSVINGNGKIALAGESAGGNMAITTAFLARDRGVPQPLHILSVYPLANNDFNTASYNQYANAMPINRPLSLWSVDKYFRTMADGDSPLISLTDVANLAGLPPTTIIAAQIDPLQTEGMQLRDKLQSQGVSVTYQLYQGVTHEFFGTYAIEPKAQQAQTLAATQLVNAFK